MLEKTGYEKALRDKGGDENLARLENIAELKTNIIGYMKETGDESLAGFLDQVALYTDIDGYNADDDCAIMMTMHSAKGLEFPVVFIVGMEEGIFPGMRAHRRPGRDGGGAQALLRRHHARQAGAVHHQRPPAHDFRPHHHEPAQPLRRTKYPRRTPSAADTAPSSSASGSRSKRLAPEPRAHAVQAVKSEPAASATANLLPWATRWSTWPSDAGR